MLCPTPPPMLSTKLTRASSEISKRPFELARSNTPRPQFMSDRLRMTLIQNNPVCANQSKKLSAICVLAAFTMGCATTQVVRDAMGQDAINTVTMTCHKPYELAQDCSIWDGANRKISVEGLDIRIAGSKDGQAILVMGGHPWKTILKEGLFWHDYRGTEANASFKAVKKILLQDNVRIVRVRPLRTAGKIIGYVFEVEGDGYAVLKPYTEK
jgi:hypothetical protein